jgi:prepilin peptidase CpaA
VQIFRYETTILQSGAPFMLYSLSTTLFPALMIAAAMTDVTSFRIPNWLTGLIAILFFPMALLTGMPMSEFVWHIAAGFILFVAGYALFAAGLFGGGDSKLMAAAGLWFGTGQTMSFLIMTAVVGGLLAIAYASWSMFILHWQIHGLEEGGKIDRSLKRVQPKLPYGFAFAVGAILAFPETYWMKIT